MKNKLKLAVVGMGLAGQRHANAILKTPHVKLVAVVDKDKKLTQKYNVKAYGDITKMIQNQKPHGIILAVPNQAHLKMTEICLAYKVPVLIEKPLADNVEDAQKISDMVGKAKLPALVGYHRRHHPVARQAKKIIQSKKLGKITAIHASFWLYKPPDYFKAQWRKTKGAGPTFINLAHDIDLIQYFCGDITDVSAMESNKVRGYEVEDTAVVAMKLKNGALATVTLSDTTVAPYSWEMTAKENPIYPATDQDCYRIGGTHATLSLPNLTIWEQKKRSWWEPIHAKKIPGEVNDPFTKQIQHFVDVIKGEAKPNVTTKQAIKTQKVINAIKKSAQKMEVTKVR